jgi:hypothetical protein
MNLSYYVVIVMNIILHAFTFSIRSLLNAKFTLPLTVIVPALSIYGIVLVHSDLPESENAKNIEATLLKEMNHTKPGKRWLETFEEDSV